MDVSPEPNFSDNPIETVQAPAPPPAERDVSRIDGAQYPHRDLPRITDHRGRGFEVVISQSVLNDMHLHGRSRPDVEVCGVLVGNVYRDANGPYLHVEANIKGDHAAGKTAQVTFTSETWTHINEEMERSHAGRKILGWYHTHPGFGIFLSEMDLFIQNNFFPELWQVAYVYDPKSDEDGIFIWKQGQATRDKYLVDPDTANTDPPKAKNQAALPSGTLGELMERVQALEHRVRWLIGAIFLVMALAVLSPLLARFIFPTTDIDETVPSNDGPAIPASLQVPPGLPASGGSKSR